ncbi:MAG: hypothetical protein NY202_02885 [Mollicutes bacterium UO1]
MGNGQSNLSDKEKTASIIGGAVVGGIIIGVTAGLATPLVAGAGEAVVDYINSGSDVSTPMQTRMNTSSGIKSPGVPTATDGFVAPRSWDGGMVKNPNGFGRGYITLPTINVSN